MLGGGVRLVKQGVPRPLARFMYIMGSFLMIVSYEIFPCDLLLWGGCMPCWAEGSQRT